MCIKIFSMFSYLDGWLVADCLPKVLLKIAANVKHWCLLLGCYFFDIFFFCHSYLLNILISLMRKSSCVLIFCSYCTFNVLDILSLIPSKDIFIKQTRQKNQILKKTFFQNVLFFT